MTNETLPWNKIKKDYVQGIADEEGLKKFPTYKKLAEKYNTTEGTIKNVGGPEKWSAKRKSYKVNVTKKALEKKSQGKVTSKNIDNNEVEEAAEFDAESIVQSDELFNGTGEKLREAVDTEIDRIVEGKIYLYSTKNGPVYGVPRNAAYLLMNLGKALESAQKVTKTAFGEPSNIEETRGTVKHEMSDFSNDERERIKELARGLTKPDNPKQQNSDS